MDLGKELIRADCPEKYYFKSIFLLSFLLAAILFVCNFMSSIYTFHVSVSFAIGLSSILSVIVFIFLAFFMYYSNKQFHGTYISVCEKGICGYHVNCGKKKSFQLYYSDIRNVKVGKGIFYHINSLNIFFKEKRGCISIIVDNPQKVADIINDKIVSKTFFNK